MIIAETPRAKLLREAVWVRRARDCGAFIITLGCLMREKARRAPHIYSRLLLRQELLKFSAPKVIIRQRAEGLMETRRLQALLCKLIFCWTSQAASRAHNFINFRNWILANDIKYCDKRL